MTPTQSELGYPKSVGSTPPSQLGYYPKSVGSGTPTQLGPTIYRNYEENYEGSTPPRSLARAAATSSKPGSATGTSGEAAWIQDPLGACPCHDTLEDHEADERAAADIRARSPEQLLDERLAELPPNVRARIVVTDDPCRWIGTPPIDRDGYARFAGKGLYRVVWELLFGPVEQGLVLDHVKSRGCATNRCSWPPHLEPVPPRINCLRGRSFAAVNARKDHCGTCGEPYDLFNTYWKPNGHRDCRSCIRRRVREYKARLRGTDLGLAA